MDQHSTIKSLLSALNAIYKSIEPTLANLAPSSRWECLSLHSFLALQSFSIETVDLPGIHQTLFGTIECKNSSTILKALYAATLVHLCNTGQISPEVVLEDIRKEFELGLPDLPFYEEDNFFFPFFVNSISQILMLSDPYKFHSFFQRFFIELFTLNLMTDENSYLHQTNTIGTYPEFHNPATEVIYQTFLLGLRSNIFVDCVRRNSMELVRKITSTLLSLCGPMSSVSTRISNMRQLITGRVLMPILLTIHTKSIHNATDTDIEETNDQPEKRVHLISTLIWDFLMALYSQKDVFSASSLLCQITLNNIPSLHNLLRTKPILWTVILQCLLQPDPVIRKRGAHLLQTLTSPEVKPSREVHPTREVTPITAGSIERLPHKPQSRKRGKKSSQIPSSTGQSADPEAEANADVPAVVRAKVAGDASDGSSWWSDFLVVYQQVEGCTSLHLIDQIWPVLIRMCAIVVDNAAEVIDRAATTGDGCLLEESLTGEQGLSRPTIGFDWLRVLFRLLLTAPVVSIRKALLHKLFSGLIPLPVSTSSADWICSELLPMIDDAMYFSPTYLGLDKDIGLIEPEQPSEISKTESTKPVSSELIHGLDPSSIPGILFPRFLSRFLRQANPFGDDIGIASHSSAAGDTDDARVSLVRGLVKALCGNGSEGAGLGSLTACKWIVRAFGSGKYGQDFHTLRLLRCLGLEDLHIVRTFIKDKLGKVNRLVRDQVLLGLIPLLVAGISHRSSSSSVPMIVNFLRFCSDVGWRLVLDPFEADGMIDTLEGRPENNRMRKSNFFYSTVDFLLSAVPLEDLPGLATHPENFELLVLLVFFSNSKSTAPQGSSVTNVSDTNYDQHINLLWEIVRNKIQFSVNLQTSPYVSVGEQMALLWTIHGMYIATRIRLESDGLHPFPGLTATSPFIRAHAAGLIAYITTILREAVAVSASYGSDVNCGRPCVLNSLREVGVAVESLGGLMALVLSPDDVSDINARNGVEVSGMEQVIALLNSWTQDLRHHKQTRVGEFPVIGRVVTVQTMALLLEQLRFVGIHLNRGGPSSTALTQKEISLALFLSVKSSLEELYSFDTPTQESFAMFTKFLQNSPSAPPILISFSDTFRHFGSLSTELMHLRWAGLRAGLEVLRLHQFSTLKIDSLVISEGSMWHVPSMLRQAMDQLDTATITSIPNILHCASIIISNDYRLENQGLRSLDNLNGAEEGVEMESSKPPPGSSFSVGIREFFEIAWRAVLGLEVLDPNALMAYTKFISSPHIVLRMDPEIMQEQFMTILEFGRNDRSVILQILVRRLCVIWKQQPSSIIPYVDKLVPELLLFKETSNADHNFTNIDLEDEDLLQKEFPVRIMVLKTLESFKDVIIGPAKDSLDLNANLRHSLCNLCLKLLELNLTPSYAKVAIQGTDRYGLKLRLWQSMCVLSTYIDENALKSENRDGGRGGVDKVMAGLLHNCDHSVRVHVEIFAAEMCRRYPTIMMPVILGGNCLGSFNHPQQPMSSYFVILGHLVLSLPVTRSLDITSPEHHMPSPAQLTPILQIVDALVPWITCAPGLARAIAQFLGFVLIPLVTGVAGGETTSPLKVEGGGNEQRTRDTAVDEGKKELLLSIWRFLDSNGDCVKLRKKQIKFFEDYLLDEKLTVQGLLSLPLDISGERMGVHLISILNDVLRVKSEDEDEDDDLRHLNITSSDGTQSPIADFTSGSVLQSKRIPFDALQLPSSNITPYGQSTGDAQNTANQGSPPTVTLLNRGHNLRRPRQDVIVCASLVTKAVNLAGIARTCEVFAVRALVIPDLAVTRTDEFRGIAVSSADWLPIEEVGGDKVVEFLRARRQEGYTIVGLEQSNHSQELGCMGLPERSVLLLGHEKEGVPVHLLSEIDLCVEIPQYGVTRSLNVHVSAALALWELTKRNKAKLGLGLSNSKNI